MAKTPEEALKWEFHITYSRGVCDGAGRKPMRREYTGHARVDLRSTYERAYVLGQKLAQAAIEAHASKIGYTPNVLRAQEVDGDGRPQPPHVGSASVARACSAPHESGHRGDPFRRRDIHITDVPEDYPYRFRRYGW